MIVTQTRRALLAGAVAATAAGPVLAQDRRMTAYKTPWCGCCDGWVSHMRAAGWTVEVVKREDLAPIRARYGVPNRYAGCHTAVAGAYAIEGHVPAPDVERLLRERPTAVALAAPGMPAGSPGMEAAGRQPYVTFLINRAGEATVFGRHNGA
ncbi:hypothetical protein RM53_13605 [Brevundimonas nasdae]|uniref:Metal-binding protein n=1 Tax=Brevundimonas nasdae TaxID=172043 RepID=A0A0B4C4R9_9CAUL|nr:DUF411 domain-containing protein [Brevundimonas nasdae]KIC56034.1 hypothetical protein RM53_13605 [Brevundimonas nasdae]